MLKPRAFVIKELREVLPATVFFAVGFNLIVLTTDLILADYTGSFESRPLSRGPLFSLVLSGQSLLRYWVARSSGDCRRRKRLARAVLQICSEQEFLADLKRERYTCEMVILPNRTR